MNYSNQPRYLTGIHGMQGMQGMQDMRDTQGIQEDSYRTAYRGGMDGTTILGHPNYSNPNNTVHNNIGQNVTLEQIYNNKIFIDASYKDYSKNPDIFQFIVKLNTIQPSVDSVSVNINNMTFSYSKYISGDPNVVIDRLFPNMKKIIIDGLILPSSIDFKTTENGAYEPTDVKLAKSQYKYIMLKINELSNARFFSNNPRLGKNTFIMVMDAAMSNYSDLWIPINVNSTHYHSPDSNLSQIDRLTIEITDDHGKKLYPTLDGKEYDFFADYRFLVDRAIQLQKINTPNSITQLNELMPRLISLKNITETIVPELHITLQTLEIQINTLPRYRN